MQLTLVTISLAVLASAAPQNGWGITLGSKGSSVKGPLGEASIGPGGIKTEFKSPSQILRDEREAAKAKFAKNSKGGAKAAKGGFGGLMGGRPANNPRGGLFGGGRQQPNVIVVPSGQPQQGYPAGPQQGYPAGPPQGYAAGPPQGYAAGPPAPNAGAPWRG